MSTRSIASLILLSCSMLLFCGVYYFVKNTPGAGPTTKMIFPTPTGKNSAVDGAQTLHSLEEVMTHNTPTNCWTSINGKVYDLTSFVHRHPGGLERIIQICGKDGSAAFTQQHDNQRKPEAELQQLYIGDLQR